VFSDSLTCHVIEIKEARKWVRGLMILACALSVISRFIISLHSLNIPFDYFGSSENYRMEVLSKYLSFAFSFWISFLSLFTPRTICRVTQNICAQTNNNIIIIIIFQLKIKSLGNMSVALLSNCPMRAADK
jgi:hypothetical protein